jgi:hypothetical protein
VLGRASFADVPSKGLDSLVRECDVPAREEASRVTSERKKIYDILSGETTGTNVQLAGSGFSNDDLSINIESST